MSDTRLQGSELVQELIGRMRSFRVPMVHSPSTAGADGGTTFHAVRPAEWPDCVDRGGSFEHRVKGIAKDLKRADLGVVVVNLKGRTEASKMVAAITVSRREKGKVGIPVCVLEEPLRPELGIAPRGQLVSVIAVRWLEWGFFSPVALYSAYPIPDMFQHYCQNSIEVLYESALAGKVLTKDGGFNPMWAADLARDTAESFFGEKLDFTPESLQAIDRICLSVRWKEQTPVLTSTELVLGGYVGEVIRKYRGGNWTMSGGFPLIALGESSAADVRQTMVDPVGRVRSAIEHGGEDTVHSLVAVFER